MKKILLISVILNALCAAAVGHMAPPPTPREELTRAGVPLVAYALIKALNHPDGEVRMYAAIVLGEDRVKRAVPDIRKALHDQTSHVRVAAAGSLIKMGDDTGLPILLKAIRDADVAVAILASNQLLANDRSDGFEDLLAKMHSGLAPFDRWLMLAQLAEYGYRFSELRLKVLDQLLRSLHEDPSKDVRVAAVLGLARFDEGQAALREAEQHDPDPEVRFHAHWGIRPPPKKQ